MSPGITCLSTLHFLKFLENSFEVLKLLENSVEVLKILENKLESMKILESKLESMKILENKLESLKLQENQPVHGVVSIPVIIDEIHVCIRIHEILGECDEIYKPETSIVKDSYDDSTTSHGDDSDTQDDDKDKDGDDDEDDLFDDNYGDDTDNELFLNGDADYLMHDVGWIREDDRVDCDYNINMDCGSNNNVDGDVDCLENNINLLERSENNLNFSVTQNNFEVLKLLENSVGVLKILENKLETMKIMENKLESLKLQENQPVDGLVPQNHREEEDQEGNKSSEITIDFPWTVAPRTSREPRTSRGRERAKSTAEVMVIDKIWTSLGKHEKAFYTGLKKFVDDCKPYIPLNNEQNDPTQGDIGETSKDPTQAKRNEFEELYASANEELYPGCDYVTRLDFMAKFTYFKVKGKLTDSIFNEMLKFFQNVFPTAKGYKLPPSYYAIKNTFKTIRQQRLYKSSHTENEMTWHATGKCTKPEPRNVRLWLAADGFNPFGNLSQSYSMWPVTLTTYNMPPWLCMKESSFMLTLLNPGPKSPGKDIDVYLRPLIDDLKDL
uniref:Uncharacterized protein n=1 Tax=Tanacetum cinerariifolium TaxID=118510 RepID=A0A699HHF4_TANCI|nr:hypothetical protein [Tanacetum cinerariifolium]